METATGSANNVSSSTRATENNSQKGTHSKIIYLAQTNIVTWRTAQLTDANAPGVHIAV